MSKEQKTSAAVAYLSKNIDQASEEIRPYLMKINIINNEGMELVRKINEMNAQITAMDSEIGQKIGGAKVLFDLVGEKLSVEDVDKFSSLFVPHKPRALENAGVDMAGITIKDKK